MYSPDNAFVSAVVLIEISMSEVPTASICSRVLSLTLYVPFGDWIISTVGPVNALVVWLYTRNFNVYNPAADHANLAVSLYVLPALKVATPVVELYVKLIDET